MRVDFFRKLAGGTQSPPRVGGTEVLWSFLGGFLGIATVAFLHFQFLEGTAFGLFIASFGASAVLIFGAFRSPLAQPRNFLGGHIFSALMGVTAWKLLSPYPWLAAALAVSSSIAAMHLTRTLHPPGGATALIAIIGGPKIHQLGYFYVLMPVSAGALIMLAVALVINNLGPGRRYPEYWY